MVRFWLLMIGICSALCAYGQEQAAYNAMGDEAMKRLDYRDAQMWYEEGVAHCNAYSITQLTAIWLKNEDMRPAMRSLMTKCINCLNVLAMENDTTAVSQLITYYTEGIGVPRNEELAAHWHNQLHVLQNPVPPSIEPLTEARKDHEPMRFFAGYAFSIESPFGITIGGIWNRMGWYARFKTNLSFDNYAYDCDEASNLMPIPEQASTQFDRSKSMKTNSFQGTAGLVVEITPWLYTSVGLGYGVRDLLCPFILTDYDSNSKKEVWACNIDDSHKGLAAEWDLMARVVGQFFVSGGVNTINFKYADLNIGLGFFF